MLHCFENDKPCKSYPISTGKNGLGERYGSECTPRGWHRIYSKIGLNAAVNSVFISRKWTGEIYSLNWLHNIRGGIGFYRVFCSWTV
ncbi:L,D-transpeptidase [Legionella micdadei]|uniref:L,D-transpeptidase n=1 Tax=Legionella micdadei TaxID=451 RepID=UPI0020A61B3B|nr:L,D-transpeptidase [Legionella micdadei]